MTTFQYGAVGYFVAAYVLGALWFLFLERKEGFLKWRIFSWVFAPLALPLLAVTNVALVLAERFLFKKKTVTEEKSGKHQQTNQS